MAANVLFPLLRTHDPSGGSRKRTIRLQLDPGDALVGPLTLTAVDTSDAALVGDSLLLENVTFGVLSGDLWGINFFPRLGSVGVTYLLRARFYLASNPGTPAEDVTVRMPCANT